MCERAAPVAVTILVVLGTTAEVAVGVSSTSEAAPKTSFGSLNLHFRKMTFGRLSLDIESAGCPVVVEGTTARAVFKVDL